MHFWGRLSPPLSHSLSFFPFIPALVFSLCMKTCLESRDYTTGFYNDRSITHILYSKNKIIFSKRLLLKSIMLKTAKREWRDHCILDPLRGTWNCHLLMFVASIAGDGVLTGTEKNGCNLLLQDSFTARSFGHPHFDWQEDRGHLRICDCKWNPKAILFLFRWPHLDVKGRSVRKRAHCIYVCGWSWVRETQ